MRNLAILLLVIPTVASSNSIGVYHAGGPYDPGGG